MGPVILIAGWLVLNAAVALGVASISHRLLGTFAEKPWLAAVPVEKPQRVAAPEEYPELGTEPPCHRCG
jgi:hypothetical protein